MHVGLYVERPLHELLKARAAETGQTVQTIGRRALLKEIAGMEQLEGWGRDYDHRRTRAVIDNGHSAHTVQPQDEQERLVACFVRDQHGRVTGIK